jgi:hypothetical protein
MKSTNPEGHTSIDGLVARLGEDDGLAREEARLALVATGEPAVPALVEALSSRIETIRWEAAKALGEIGSAAAVPALIKALEDNDFDVRWLAAEALIAIGQESMVPILEALVERSEQFLLRQGAHHVLSHFGRTDARVAHHEFEHPRNAPAVLKPILRPVIAALEGPAPRGETPGAAQHAIDQVRLLPTDPDLTRKP